MIEVEDGISVEVLQKIEEALGIELYPNQKNYLMGTGGLGISRASGKTLAYCINLALSKGRKLDLKEPQEYSDEERLIYFGKAKHDYYSMTVFLPMFLDVRQKLKDAGFIVRKIKS